MYYFIINPASKSGQGKKVWQETKKILDSSNVTYKHYFTKEQYHAIQIGKEIVKQKGEKHIIVVGGDGTLNEVLNSLDNMREIFLSYIPAGSGNDFARSISSIKTPANALMHILNNNTITFYDQGLCITHTTGSHPIRHFSHGRKFAVSCGIGFDAAICYEALTSKIKPLLNRLKLGKLTYVLIALKQLITYKPADVTVLINSTSKRIYPKVFFIAGMNQQYEGGGFKMAPGADPADRKLSVAIYYNLSKIKALLMLPCILLGLQTHFKGMDSFDCSSIEIRTAHPLIIHTDGEFAGNSNYLKMEILPEQINYIK